MFIVMGMLQGHNNHTHLIPSVPSEKTIQTNQISYTITTHTRTFKHTVTLVPSSHTHKQHTCTQTQTQTHTHTHTHCHSAINGVDYVVFVSGAQVAFATAVFENNLRKVNFHFHDSIYSITIKLIVWNQYY